LKLLFAQSSQR